MKLKLDYQIHDYLDNHPSDDGYKYDHIEWQVQIHNQELLDELNYKFGCNFNIDEINVVTPYFANMIKEYCWGKARKNKYNGTYGTKYKNELLIL